MLTRHLEHQVLVRNCGSVEVGEGNLVFLVISSNEIEEDSTRFPDCEVIVRMVNECWHAPIGVQIGVRWLFMVLCVTKC